MHHEHPTLDALRITVGDELQGVYATLGEALAASYRLRLLLVGQVELRFGLGGGDVRVLDTERGIQDGDAWALAREAIDQTEALAHDSQYAGVRTGICDARAVSTPLALATVRLVDAQLARVEDGPRTSLRYLLEGMENQQAAHAPPLRQTRSGCAQTNCACLPTQSPRCASSRSSAPR